MPDKADGPCQAPGEELGTFCGETLSSCWYGKVKKGTHFCSIHCAAWEVGRLQAARRYRGSRRGDRVDRGR